MRQKSKVVAGKENVERLLNAPPSTSAANDSLWPGCLFDTHCHLNLVHRYGITSNVPIWPVNVTSM